MPTETPRRYGKKSLFSINGLAIIGPKPEPKPLIINSKPIPAANSPKLVSMPIKISKKTCAPPPDAHIPLANTTLPIAGSLRIYFQPEIISLNADLGVSLPLTGLSGPPGGRVDINKIESKKVEQSIHKAVVIPNSEIVKPPIPAPIPKATDHPPEPNAFAVISSSFEQILGRYENSAGSNSDFAKTIINARK